MRIYRDCAGEGADFDSESGAPTGTISIYGLAGEPPINIDLRSPRVRQIRLDSNPCVQLPDYICVEEGLYTFEIELPVIDESYIIVYQRCCRNVTVSNIRQPGQAGATYFTEITPIAQRTYNRSARFTRFPLAALCLDENFSFSQGGEDPDGDSLVYEFFTPLIGGGRNVDDAEAPDGVTPNPDLPPPYGSVEFIESIYSVDQPLGYLSDFNLDARTGRISGRPRLWGQFAVGIVIKEYRDGELIGQFRRDFQINVVPCFASVVTHVENADSSFRQNEFFLWSCNGETNVFFDNQSFNRISIDETRWEFYINGDTLRQSEWDAEFNFPGVGVYEGALLANPGGTCGDTARLVVTVEDPIDASFTTISDSCLAAPIQFEDLTLPNPFPMEQWTWYFGDGNSSSLQNPEHLYRTIGDYEVSLRVGTRYCDTITSKTISYFPAPTITSIIPDTAIFCGPSTTDFSYVSLPSGDAYETQWIFSEVDTFSTRQVTYNYDSIGMFDVRLQITSPTGCQTDSLLRDLVTILPPLEADFAVMYDSCALDSIRLQDLSQAEGVPPTSWLWNFGDGNLSSFPNPSHFYQSAGQKNISLTVRLGQCEATAEQNISYFPVPDSLNISPQAAVYCGAQTLLFQPTNPFNLTDDYTVVWDLGDGTTANGEVIEHGYTEIGVYDISLSVNAPNGCQSSTFYENWVQIDGEPIADFDYTPDVPNFLNPEVQFINLSSDAVAYNWLFNEEETNTAFEPIHTFSDTGFQEVTLIVTHESGCQDSLTQLIDIPPIIQAYLATAFSPNDDGVNDLFQLQGILLGIQNFQMSVWDRWGNLVFESTNPTIPWDGKTANLRQENTHAATYAYYVSYQDARGNPFEHSGSILVVR